MRVRQAKEPPLLAQLTVVDFFATWCGPCKAIAPLVEQLSKQYTDVAFIKVSGGGAAWALTIRAQVDVDQVPDVAKQCAITAMPTFQFYKSGNKVDEFKGADANRLKSTIDKHRYACVGQQSNSEHAVVALSLSVAGAGNGNFPSGGGHRLGDGTPASSSSSSGNVIG